VYDEARENGERASGQNADKCCDLEGLDEDSAALTLVHARSPNVERNGDDGAGTNNAICAATAPAAYRPATVAEKK